MIGSRSGNTLRDGVGRVTGSKRGQTMTQVDTAETGQGGTGRRQAGSRTGARIQQAMSAACRPGPWKRGPMLAALALLLALFMLLHAQIPNRIGNLGSLVETFLPWFGLFIPVLLAGALWRRSASATVALLLPAVVWLNLFGGLLADKSGPGGDLTVVQHNVGAENPDPVGTARDLAASGADLLALVELTEQARGTYEQELATAYPHHTVQGTVGLWSKLPLSDTRAIDTKMDAGPLGDAKTAERNERVVLLGDLNGTVDDRALAGLTAQLRSTHDVAGDGFGFSWPALFPVVRIDQILVRGVQPESSWVLPATGSDHLPVAAGISW